MKASEAFDPNRPLPQSALDALDLVNRKDQRLDELEQLFSVEAVGDGSAERPWKTTALINAVKTLRS